LHRWTVLPEAGNLLKARAAVEKKREQSWPLGQVNETHFFWYSAFQQLPDYLREQQIFLMARPLTFLRLSATPYWSLMDHSDSLPSPELPAPYSALQGSDTSPCWMPRKAQSSSSSDTVTCWSKVKPLALLLFESSCGFLMQKTQGSMLELGCKVLPKGPCIQVSVLSLVLWEVVESLRDGACRGAF
jgi:hypothetical protein